SSTTINLRVSGTGTSAGSTIISLSQSSLALNNTLITSAIQITGTVQTTSGTISAVQFAIDASQNWLDANIAARRPSGSGEEADFAVLIDPSLLTPGNHTLLIRGRVSSGLYSGIISLNFRTEAGSSPNRPTLNIQSPQQGSVVSGTITVSGNASDPDNDLVKVEWAIDSTSPSAWNPVSGKTSWSFTIDTTKYTEGNHMIYVRATDAANLSNTSSLSLKFTKKEESSSSNRRVWILLGIVFLIALIVLVIGAIVRRQRGMKILASPQEQVETGPQTFVIENEKIICYACEIPLKKGDNAIKCTCNKVYHQKCANNIEECAFCSSPVSTKVKF
ncbi:MAG: Ig-like domain-containing protein, partial [Thermoplasmata archaeon]